MLQNFSLNKNIAFLENMYIILFYYYPEFDITKMYKKKSILTLTLKGKLIFSTPFRGGVI